MASNIRATIDRNEAEKRKIEGEVGYDYSELYANEPRKNTDKQFYKNLLLGAYFASGILFILFGGGTGSFLLSVVYTLLWPIFSLVGFGIDVWSALAPIVIFCVIAAAPSIIYVIRKTIFANNLPERKSRLDLYRIARMQALSSENVSLSANSSLLADVIYELKELKDRASILKLTHQFDGLSSMDIVKKIEYATMRMRAAQISFDVACANYLRNASGISVTMPFVDQRQYNDIRLLVESVLEYIKS